MDPNIAPNGETYINPIEPSVIPQATDPVNKKSNIIAILVGIIIVLSLFLAATIFIILKGNLVTTYKSSTSSVTPTPSVANQFVDSGSLYFLKNDSVWKYDAGKVEMISDPKLVVFGIAQDPNSSAVAFITGEKIVTTDSTYHTNTRLNPDTVYVYTSEDKKARNVFYLKPEVVKGQYEVENKIFDINFSESGKKLAITTSDSLLVYDITSQKLDKIFTIPLNPSSGNPIFAIKAPVFSPNETKVIVNKGFWEGQSAVLVDLKAKGITDLPYQDYIMGKSVIAWKDDSNLFVGDYSGEDEDIYKRTFNLKTANISKPEVLTPAFDSAPNLGGYILITKSKIYGIASYTKDNPALTKDPKYPQVDTYYEVYEFDIPTKTRKIINTLKREDDPTKRQVWYDKLRLSADQKILFIGTTIYEDRTQSQSIFAIDLVAGSEPKEILLGGSF